MDKKTLTETDIQTKFITPALVGADGGKRDLMTQDSRGGLLLQGARAITRWLGQASAVFPASVVITLPLETPSIFSREPL